MGLYRLGKEALTQLEYVQLQKQEALEILKSKEGTPRQRQRKAIKALQLDSKTLNKQKNNRKAEEFRNLVSFANEQRRKISLGAAPKGLLPAQ